MFFKEIIVFFNSCISFAVAHAGAEVSCVSMLFAYNPARFWYECLPQRMVYYFALSGTV